MRKPYPIFCPTHLVAALLLTSAGIASAAGVPKNAFDMPVLDSKGSPINYTRDELSGKVPAPLSTSLKAPASAPLQAASTGENLPEARATWVYPFLGNGLGRSLWAGPSDAGHPEIYASSTGSVYHANSFWAAFTYNSENGAYDIVFGSEAYASSIVAITVADVYGSSKNEIIVCLQDGTVRFYDQASKSLVKQFSVPASISAMHTADLDGTGKAEIILCNSSFTAVFSGDEMQWHVNVGGTDIAVGQMDSDPALEIAVTSGNVIDCETRTVQWQYDNPFGARLEAADIDSDGKAELIAAEGWYYVWAFDVDVQMPKWSHSTTLDVTALALTDVDGDGKVEIAIGDGQWGNVYGIDPVTRAVKYSVKNPEHGVANIASADLDGDGKTELIWGAGFSSSGKDQLYVADPVTKTIEWQSMDLDGPVVGPAIGDLDGDGKDELVISSFESDSGYGSGRLLVFDNQTLKLRAVSTPMFNNIAWEGIGDLKLHDVDNDGKLEIMVAAGYHYDGAIEIWKFNADNSFTRVWETASNPQGETYTALDVADVDGDGKLEILAGNSRSHTGSSGTFLRLIDYASREIKWTSFHLAQGSGWGSIADVAAADVDTSEGLEMMALTDGGKLYIFDGTTREGKAIISGSFTNLQISGKSLFLSTTAGAIKEYQFNGTIYTEVSSTQVSDRRIDGFNILNGPAKMFTFGQDGRLHVFAGGKVRFRSAPYGVPYGARVAGRATGGSYCLAVHRGYLPPVLAKEPPVTHGTSHVVEWTYTFGADSYIVEAATDPAFNNIIASEAEVGFEHEFLNMKIGHTYYFRVKAIFQDEQTESDWSATEFTLHEAAPTAATDWQLFI